MLSRSILALGLLLPLVPVQAALGDDVLVGVSYFPGWWRPMPNKWHKAGGEDWRYEFPARLPLLGQYNDQETMDEEIAAAAEHGVDFFSILWYCQRADARPEPNCEYLSRGVSNFMSSPEAGRMKFMVEFCNHPPYQVTSGFAWKLCIAAWLELMKHPSYLRVAGKLVFKVHGGHYFFEQNQRGLGQCRERLDALRAAVRDAGLGEMLIGCGVGAHEAVTADHYAAKLFDFTATYMGVPDLEQEDYDYAYGALAEFAERGRAKHTADAIPYMPYVPAGWCPRPWPDPRPCFAFPSAGEWACVLERVKADLKAHPGLGLPGLDAFTIYAWNEFGEGGIVAPTRGEGYMKLEGIAKAFPSRH